ncbi:MAG TPA: zinc-ribbon domain-containing protein [Ktedonobacteraceae bacterium]|nr:zinc-ribbon domain-containing protein [Ktedonobacteraceae bacterium]
MHCPYCGSLNSDRATYCTRCGRDLPKEPVQGQGQGRPAQTPTPGQRQPSYQPARQAPPQNPYQQAYPTSGRPVPPPVQRPPAQQPPVAPPRPQPQQPRSSRTGAASLASSVPAQPFAMPEPAAPEAPVPFPPRTMEHLRALEPGAQAYTVVDSSVATGKKKIVRIAYPRCVSWQQVATLLKALKEQQEDRFDSITVQGVFPGSPDVYSFTNGQLSFDRNVLLGSQKLTRYIVETGNGFDGDSVRIVLTE